MKQITIYEALWDKLGREPTNEELRNEVFRILNDVTIKRANKGKLKHQRKQ